MVSKTLRKFTLPAMRAFLKAAALETPDSPGRTAEQIGAHLNCSAKTVMSNVIPSMSEACGVKHLRPGVHVRMGLPEQFAYYPPPGVIEGNPSRTPTIEEHEACIAGMRAALAAAGITYDEAQHYRRQVLPNEGRAHSARHAAAKRRLAISGSGSSLDSWLNDEPQSEPAE